MGNCTFGQAIICLFGQGWQAVDNRRSQATDNPTITLLMFVLHGSNLR